MNLKIRGINSKRLFYFGEVFKQGSLSAAADALDMVQAGIGRQISNLEQELDVLLFQRGTKGRGMVPGGQGRGMVPTEAGRIVYDFYHQYCECYEKLEFALEEWRNGKRGDTYIAMPSAYIGAFTESLFEDSYDEHCSINIDEVNATFQIENKVREDATHMGIAFSNHVPAADIRYHQCAPLPIYLIIGKSHPLASKRSVTFSEAARYPLALSPSSFKLRQIINSVAHSEKIPLTPSFISGSVSAQKKFCSANHGAAFMSAFAARQEIKAGQLIALEVDHPAFMSTKVCLISSAHKSFSPATNKLLRLLARKFSIFSQEI